MLKVTVIMPTWNQAAFVEDTIKSVIKQTYQNIEFIIVDNCSDDGTEEIIRKYREQNASIVYIREKDKGQADAINKGFLHATGDVICWINSDDFYYSDTVIEQVVRQFEEHSDIMVIAGNGYYCNKNGELTEKIICPHNEPKRVLERWDYLLQPSVFWRRQKNMELDIHYHYVFDWKFFVTLQRQYDFLFVDDYLSVYRMYDDNKTGADNTARKKEVYLLQKEIKANACNRLWCRLVYRVYAQCEKKKKIGCKPIIKWLNKALFHVSGKRVCSF